MLIWIVMQLNAFNYTFRQVLKQRSQSLLNVLGLATGIASALLLFRVVQFHESFEDFRPGAARIFRVTTTSKRGADVFHTAGIPFPFEKAIRLSLPHIEKITTISQPYQTQVTVPAWGAGGHVKMFKEASSVTYVQPAYFEIFKTQWLAGNYGSMADPSAAAISYSYAVKCFGSWQQALGKLMRINNGISYTIRGIFMDPPSNTDFQMQVALAYSSLPASKDTNWGSTWSSTMCFIKLLPGTSPAQIDGLLAQYVRAHFGKMSSSPKYVLQALTGMHYSQDFSTVSVDPVSRPVLISLTFLGIFLILIASINYVNLSTATAMNRAKEIGVRKVLGSSRRQIMLNYLAEAFVVTCISGILALVLCEVFFPQVRALLGLPAGLGFLNPYMAGLFILVILVASLLSGLYPALILSALKPAQAIKAQHILPGSGQVFMRRGLVVLQFLISQVLIICTLIGINQVNYFSHSNMGFYKEAIVGVPIPADSTGVSKIRQLRDELSAFPGMKSMSFSNSPVLSGYDYETSIELAGSTKKIDWPANLKYADSSFFSTYQLHFIAGHGYKATDTLVQLVINETMAHKLGFKDPVNALGRQISIDMGQLKPIVGVVEDYHNSPLKMAIAPIILASNLKSYQYLGVKLSGSDLKTELEELSTVWKRIYPEYVYEYTFLDKDIASNYEQEQRLADLLKIFAAISIFIGCLGLYGLVSFMALQKTKEIGIRKVLGASLVQILQLFSTEFLLLVGFSFILAVPLAWYLMDQWLSDFKYHISISWIYFALAGLLTLILAFITISSKGLQAARTNPAKNLRIE